MPLKTITVTEPDPTKITFIDKVIGGIFLGSFVFVWIMSISSPFLFFLALKNAYYKFATFIITVTFLSYAPWKSGAMLEFIRRSCNHYSVRYFKSFSIVFEGDKIPIPKSSTQPQQQQPQTFYSIHPHGAFCIGWAMLFCHDVMQHVRFCFSPILYASPFFRLFSRIMGNPGSASKHEMIKYMKAGNDLALPPGGFEEATLSSVTQDRVFIKKRTGFIKLCLQHGIQVRPVYVFGEKCLFWNIQGCFKTRLGLNRQGFPAILTWGHPLFPLIPKNTVPVRIVVGAPLVLPMIANPTKEDTELWHGKYVAALNKIFDEQKELIYGPDAKVMKLEIW